MKPSLDSLVIQTPEGCRFALPLAGPFSRFLAWVIDLLVNVAIVYTASKIASALGAAASDFAGAFIILAFFVTWFGYGIVLEWFWQGKTIGKRIMRLQVIDEYALRLTFSQVMIRNLLRMVDALPLLYLVGGVSCMLSRKLQRLGDMVAGTVVVRTNRAALPDTIEMMENKYNSFRQYPHLAAKLRQRVTGAEAHLARQALMRRESLDSQARMELFGGIARHFEQIVSFPQEAADGLSDEQYVRNIVEILFASDRSSGKI